MLPHTFLKRGRPKDDHRRVTRTKIIMFLTKNRDDVFTQIQKF